MSDDLFVNTWDFSLFSGPQEFHVNVPADHAPTVTAPDFSASQRTGGQRVDLFSASDGDGDSLLYFFYDNSADPASGHFTVNGVVQAAGTTFAVTAAQLARPPSRQGSCLGRSVRERLGWRRLQRAEGVPRQRGEQRADGHGA